MTKAPASSTPDPRAALQARLGYTFRDPALLELAMRHASVADARVRSNERLEFLGDAVLSLVTCNHIYHRYPDLLEGEMTKIKSAVVARNTCALIADELGLTTFLELGKGMKTAPTLPMSLAAAALEAVIGAVFLDGGMEPVSRILNPLLIPRIEKAAASGHQDNYKSILQQYAQQHLTQTPLYSVMSQKGPDHAKHFQVSVSIGERAFPACWGASKKAAEQAAALTALHELGLIEMGEGGTPTLVASRLNPSSEEAAKNGAGHPASAGGEPPAPGAASVLSAAGGTRAVR
jgi:ribonuclease-3